MAMRETMGSLKAYFWVVGVLTIGGNLGPLQQPNAESLARILAGIAVGLGCCYIYVGASLRKLVVAPPTTVITVLGASSAVLAANFILAITTASGGVVLPVIGLLINWYLLTNVRRLAAKGENAYSTP